MITSRSCRGVWRRLVLLLAAVGLSACATAGLRPAEGVEVADERGQTLPANLAGLRFYRVSTDIAFGEAPPSSLRTSASEDTRSYIQQSIPTLREPAPSSPERNNLLLVVVTTVVAMLIVLFIILFMRKSRGAGILARLFALLLAGALLLDAGVRFIASPDLIIDNAGPDLLTASVGTEKRTVQAGTYIVWSFTGSPTRLELRRGETLIETAKLRWDDSLGGRLENMFAKTAYVYNCLGANSYREAKATYRK